MNLFNLFGTGNDLNTGTFLTLNGKRAKDSIKDFRKAFSEANLLGGTKKGTLFSWLTGNFNNDYDFAKDLDNDVVALQAFMEAVKNGIKPIDAINDNLKDTSVVLQDFVAHTDDASIYVLSRATWVKNLFKKTIAFSPSKTIFDDVIDYEKGTYIYVKTDKWIISGIYIGIDKDAMGVIVKDYKLYNAAGDEFDTPECSIATVLLNKIEYTSLTYPEKSKVKKSWFDN